MHGGDKVSLRLTDVAKHSVKYNTMAFSNSREVSRNAIFPILVDLS